MYFGIGLFAGWISIFIFPITRIMVSTTRICMKGIPETLTRPAT